MASLPQQGEMGRLQATFLNAPASSHGSKWDDLWKDSYTPWDRGGPSLALLDTITSKTDLFPPPPPRPPPPNAKRRTALVPGCGRGHDVILLSELGYDVVGLDYSAAAVREAAILEKEVRQDGKGKEAYQSVEGKRGDKGSITWVEGDFFDDAWLRTVGNTQFDVIFDYTFFCALLPEVRAKWAKRMSGLLKPDGGTLICLEWPLGKPASAGGPPWGLTREVYIAHLSHPGEEVRYGDDGQPLPEEVNRPRTDLGLKCLTRFQPQRTHKAGYDSDSGKIIDYISVWSH